MKEKKSRKERLSIYLAKEPTSADKDLVNVADSKDPIPLAVGNSEGTLYVKKERPGIAPPWTTIFTASENFPEGIFGSTKTVGAALIVRRAQHTFLLSFGTGFHLLNTDAIERDFGLRVALNSVNPDKLRSLDKSNYEDNPLNSRTQSTTEVDIFDLDMDSDLEMLYALTGASQVPIFGNQITGRDALTLVVETDLKGLEKILDEAIKRYKAKLPPQFEWIDNVRKVKDVETIDLLDLLLNDELVNNPNATIWLGEPEVVDWEAQIGYSFDMYANTLRHVVLRLGDLRAYVEEKGRDFTLEAVKAAQVHINNAEFQSTKSWSAYRCLYAEIPNGVWYQVDSGFVAEIDKYLADLHAYAYAFPIYSQDREEDYNEAVAAGDKNVCVMDKKNTKIGGQYDKIEFCDLIRNGTDLIHVKYYRSSGTLSHLFSQGFVAAEAFVKDEGFRKGLNGKLPPAIRLKDPNARPDAKMYCVVYALATTKKLPGELPFFSKVTLRNAVRTLRALGYEVRMSAIEVDPKLLVKKKAKPH
jgi:uncharacterized protein (TIGR04141 family)